MTKGGARQGAGRKTVPPEQHLKRRMVQLSDIQIQTAKQLGNGNLTEGIRKAIDTYKENKTMALYTYEITLKPYSSPDDLQALDAITEEPIERIDATIYQAKTLSYGRLEARLNQIEAVQSYRELVDLRDEDYW